jgi:hypothetical protein
MKARMRVAFRMCHLLFQNRRRWDDPHDWMSTRIVPREEHMARIAHGQDGQLTAQHRCDNNQPRGARRFGE